MDTIYENVVSVRCYGNINTVVFHSSEDIIVRQINSSHNKAAAEGPSICVCTNVNSDCKCSFCGFNNNTGRYILNLLTYDSSMSSQRWDNTALVRNRFDGNLITILKNNVAVTILDSSFMFNSKANDELLVFGIRYGAFMILNCQFSDEAAPPADSNSGNVFNVADYQEQLVHYFDCINTGSDFTPIQHLTLLLPLTICQ